MRFGKKQLLRKSFGRPILFRMCINQHNDAINNGIMADVSIFLTWHFIDQIQQDLPQNTPHQQPGILL